MTADPQPHCLLEELDRMQDEVLQGLDELDGRIDDLIKQCMSSHARNLTVVDGDEGLSEAA